MEFATKDNLILVAAHTAEIYPTIQIGNQSWMAVNLAESDGGSGIENPNNAGSGSAFNSYYYYTLDAAKRIAERYPGWRVPTSADWNTLSSYLWTTYSGSQSDSASGKLVGDFLRPNSGSCFWTASYYHDTAPTIRNISKFSAEAVGNMRYESSWEGEGIAQFNNGSLAVFLADERLVSYNRDCELVYKLHYNGYYNPMTQQWYGEDGLYTGAEPLPYFTAEDEILWPYVSVRLVHDGSAKLTGYVPDCAYCIVDKYNPLNLPPYTMRLRYKDGSDQLVHFDSARNSCIFTQISESPNIWDVTRTAADSRGDISGWGYLFADHFDLLEVIGANTEGVTSLYHTFTNCPNLSSVCLFNTENVVNSEGMFHYEHNGGFPGIVGDSGCTALSSLPDFSFNSLTNMKRMYVGCPNLSSIKMNNLQNVSSMTEAFRNCSSLQYADLGNLNNLIGAQYAFENCSALESTNLSNLNNIEAMRSMFMNCTSLTALPTINSDNLTAVRDAFINCYNVTGGILDMYNQFTSQDVPPASYTGCFRNCGINTVQGAAELAQIPDDWK